MPFSKRSLAVIGLLALCLLLSSVSAEPYPIEQTMSARQSIRNYTDVNITNDQLLKVLRDSYGYWNDHRSVPKIGNDYSLVIFPVNSTGSYRYIPEKNSLVVHDMAALLLIIIGLVVAYVALRFIITSTVQAYPKVTFWQWSTSQKKNTFDHPLNIFAGLKTIDENVTHGIFNDDSTQHQCYLRVTSVTNSANIAGLNITIYDNTNRIFTKEWIQLGTLPTMWESFTVAGNTKYAIWLEITATTSPSESSIFEIEIKENNP